MIVTKSSDGALGVDTILTFTKPMAARFKAAGYDFVVRYLGALTDYERDAILESGLALLAVGYSRRPGWKPSDTLGTQDGLHHIDCAKKSGLPTGMSIFCDLEGPGGTGNDSIAYVNNWAHVIQSEGYVAGLYVGYGIQLTSDQMYHALAVTAYWDSCSRNQDVSVRGFQMVQRYPGNQHVLGYQVDIDEIHADKLGDTPMWLESGQ